MPGDIVGDMTSIGTLFAFMLVCAGVWILRVKEPELPRDFRTPLVPLFPILGIIVCGAMILGLGWTNWLRLGVWLVIGLVIYASYGRKHSQLRGRSTRADRADWRRRRWPAVLRRGGVASAVAMTGGMLNVARMTRPGSVDDIFQRRMVCTMQSPTSSSSVVPAARPTEPGCPLGSM